MGFPNAGVEALRIERSPARIGINIGRSKETPPERAAEDYCALLERVHAAADYVTLNISSPNTPGLRGLQARAALEELLGAVARTRANLAPRPPLLVKIAPDLTEAEIDEVLAAVTALGLDGVIATNTTVRREGIPEKFAGLAGGLSGAPLAARATAVVRYIAQQTRGALPIIGVGGIMSAADALEKIRAGATLIQIYTGLIYAGPGLVRQINRGLLRECERAGAKNVAELSAA
jgi:dihydroorotate dehydrogenase